MIEKHGSSSSCTSSPNENERSWHMWRCTNMCQSCWSVWIIITNTTQGNVLLVKYLWELYSSNRNTTTFLSAHLVRKLIDNVSAMSNLRAIYCWYKWFCMESVTIDLPMCLSSYACFLIGSGFGLVGRNRCSRWRNTKTIINSYILWWDHTLVR